MAKEAVVIAVRDEPRVGMLWYDESGTLGERVRRAVEYYAKKYGEEPTWVKVARVDFEDGVKLAEPADNMLPFHIWVGA